MNRIGTDHGNQVSGRQLASGRAMMLAALLAAACPVPAVEWPWQPGVDVIGEPQTDRVREGDTLVALARLHNLGHWEIRHANPDLDVFLPEPGAEVVIPQIRVLPDGPREGVVINLAELRLYYFAPAWPDREGPQVSTHPVGVGLLDRATPTGEMRVAHKLDNPAWYPTQGVRDYYAAQGEWVPAMVPPGPDNPLGAHAIVLDRDGYLIHGTHRPAGVGMRVSQGCIRLYPEGISKLIRAVPMGARVRIIDQRIKLGWRENQLYLEVHPVIADAIEQPWGAEQAAELAAAQARVRQLIATHGDGVTVDWARIEASFHRADGIARIIATAATGT